MQNQEMFAVYDKKYCVPSQVDLIMQEKLFSIFKEQFKIKDRFDQLFFQLKGNTFSFGDRKTLLDKDGNQIAGIRKKYLKIRQTFVCYDNEKSIMFLISKKLFRCFGVGLSVQVVNKVTGKTHKVKVDGDWLSREFKVFVKETNQTLAVVTRNAANLQGILFDRQKYILSVMPGVDATFIVMLMMAIAEMREK
jgi:uncharacterized protein YxjI